VVKLETEGQKNNISNDLSCLIDGMLTRLMCEYTRRFCQ